MLYHQLDPNKWKEIASQVLGNDFFSGFADIASQGPNLIFTKMLQKLSF